MPRPPSTKRGTITPKNKTMRNNQSSLPKPSKNRPGSIKTGVYEDYSTRQNITKKKPGVKPGVKK